MKFVLLSDIHSESKNPVARKDNIADTTRRKLRDIFSHAKKTNSVVLQAGDLSNKPRDWIVLDILVDLLLNEFPKVKMFCVMGQHDSYMRAAIEEIPTTMSLLVKTGAINFLSSKATKIKDVFIYGASWKEKIPEPFGEKNILVVHAPISKEKLFPKHKITKPKVFAKKFKGYDLILTGDVHRKFVTTKDQTTILNTGPLLRLEGNKYNFRHRPCYYIWDSENFTLEKNTVPHEKASKILTRIHIKKGKKSKETNQVESIVDELVSSTKTGYPKVKEVLYDIFEKRGTKKRIKRIINKAMVE